MQRWMACADLHGDKQDKKAVTLFKKHAEQFDPKHRIFLGDIWDFRAWRRGAGEKEKRDRVQRDFKMGMEFLNWYRPTAITLGNHDVRMWDQVENDGPMADLCEEMIGKFKREMRRMGTRVLPYHKRSIYRLGRMKFAHGFYDSINGTRQMANAYGSIQIGHGHTIELVSSAADHPRAARMIGCLCQLDFKYNRAQVNSLRQRHGWSYGPLFDDGTYQAFQAEVIGNKVVVADKSSVISL